MTTETSEEYAIDPPTAPQPGVSGGLLLVLLLASTLGMMAGAIVMPVLELIRNEFGISVTAVGFVATAHCALIAVTSPLVGRAIDRWGVRIPLGAGLVLYGAAGGAGLVTSSFPALIITRMLLGVGAAAVFSGTTVALLAAGSGARQDRIMGWRTAAVTASGVIWPMLAGLLGGISWHATFAIYLVGIPFGVATLLLMPNERKRLSGHTPLSAFDLLRRYPTLLGWNALMACIGLMMFSLVVFVPQRLAQIGIHQPVFSSLFMALLSLASSLIGLGYGRIRARAGFDAVLRTGVACWVGTFLLLGVSSHPVPIFAAAALFGIGYGLLLPAVTVLIGETPPVSQRGQATSLSGTAAFVGQFFSSLIFGPVMGATSITAGYLLAAGIVTAIMIILLRSRIRDPRPKPVAVVGR
ncbi:MFS transporter [Nocardia sp. NBC_00881]|uniref:MFS transporter n=1 Tax=Nocardia sp. NBC_00881 TaxID=2975995 RepID=UPI00386C2B92|nr:MFS transporter [Nocardia sp. NBC_00881]